MLCARSFLLPEFTHLKSHNQRRLFFLSSNRNRSASAVVGTEMPLDISPLSVL